MEHHITHIREFQRHVHARWHAALAVLAAVLAIVVGLGAPAMAGGWALGSLDELPDARSGATEQVGFTILQHGVTPAAVDGEPGIEIVGSDGVVEFFEAVPDELVGHYVASVTFPDAGDYTWAIRMGWFPPQDLGALTVAPASSAGGVGLWSTARWGVLGVAGVLAVVALMNLVSGRRRAVVVSP